MASPSLWSAARLPSPLPFYTLFTFLRALGCGWLVMGCVFFFYLPQIKHAIYQKHLKRGHKKRKENEQPREDWNMLIMCEVVSNECQAPPPLCPLPRAPLPYLPHTHTAKPKKRKEGRWLFSPRQTLSKRADCSQPGYFLMILF